MSSIYTPFVTINDCCTCVCGNENITIIVIASNLTDNDDNSMVVAQSDAPFGNHLHGHIVFSSSAA